MSLYENINRRRKLGISRSKADSTISKSSYNNMEKGFPKKAATGKIMKKEFGKGGRIIKAKIGISAIQEIKKPTLIEKAGKATAALYRKLPEEGLISKGKRAAKKIASKAKNLFKASKAAVPAAATGKTLSKSKELIKYTGKIGKASKLAKVSKLARAAKLARVGYSSGFSFNSGGSCL